MYILTASNKYDIKTYGYGATLPTGERTFACTLTIPDGTSAMDVAKDLISCDIQIHREEADGETWADTLVQVVAGFTQIRQYSCSITANKETETSIILQEPGIQAQIDLLTTALNEVIFSVLPGLEGE